MLRELMAQRERDARRARRIATFMLALLAMAYAFSY